MSLDIMNGVNVIPVSNIANQLVLREPHSLFLALWMVTVMGSMCSSYCNSARSGEVLRSFHQPGDQLCIRIAKYILQYGDSLFSVTHRGGNACGCCSLSYGLEKRGLKNS